MFQSIVDAMEKISLNNLEEQLWSIIKKHEAEFHARNRESDFPVNHSPEFQRCLDTVITQFLEELASGRLDSVQSQKIARTLLGVRCYTSR